MPTIRNGRLKELRRMPPKMRSKLIAISRIAVVKERSQRGLMKHAQLQQ